MDIFFLEPDEIPLPPEEVRIRTLRAELRPDGIRVRLYLEVDPFQKKPNADIVITDPTGVVAADASIIEPMTRKMELTMHLRGDLPAGQYSVHARLYYSEIEETTDAEPLQETVPVDEAETYFDLPA